MPENATSYPVDNQSLDVQPGVQQWNFVVMEDADDVLRIDPERVEKNDPPNINNDGQTSKLPCDDCDQLYPLCSKQHEYDLLLISFVYIF